MAYGKTINLHLVDGTPNGLWSAEIRASWTGRMFRVSRASLDALNEFEDARGPGVYLLISGPPTNGGKFTIYIGESDSVFDRLLQHDKSKAKLFWHDTILVVSKDDNLTKSHTLYLESRLIATAKAAGQTVSDNGTNPEKSLPRPDQSDMEYFLDQILLMLPVMGYSVMIPPPVSQKRDGEQVPRFEMEVANVKASMELRDDEFAILKGSGANGKETSSISPGYAELRKELVTSGVLVKKPSGTDYEFSRDYSFNSASRAAVVVYGGNVSGRQIWRLSGTDQSYGEWAEAQERSTIPKPPKSADAAVEDRSAIAGAPVSPLATALNQESTET